MKTKMVPLILLSSAAFFVGFVALTYISSNDPPSVSAGQLPNNLATPTPYTTSKPGGSAQVLEKYANTAIITQMANGVEMSAANFRIEQNELNGINEFRADVCFQLPNNEDWHVKEAVIQFGDTEIPIQSGKAIELSSTLPDGTKRVTSFPNTSTGITDRTWIDTKNDGTPDYRCDMLSFRLNSDMFPSSITLAIKSLHTSPREGEECTKYRDNLQSVLDANGTGILLDCVKQEYGSITSIAEKPEAMSDEEAQRLINEAKYKITTIDGPWIFTASIE